MKQTVDFSMFERAFRDMNRATHFSYSGLRALFEYLEEMEEDTGYELELGVIAICCDYAEYDSEEFMAEYGHLLSDDEEDDETEEEKLERLLEELRNHTIIIDFRKSNVSEDGTLYYTRAYIVQTF